MREVSVSADDVVSRAVAPLMDTYHRLNFDALSPKDGQIEISGLQEAAPNLSQAAETVKLSHQRLASIDRSSLFPVLAEPVYSATLQLNGLSQVLEIASSSAQLLPSMLGAEEPRNYLLLVQNSAEVRATGGIPGALAILHTDKGQISLGAQSSAVALGSFVPPLPVDPAQESIFTTRLGTQMQNVNLTPDFPSAAAMAKGMWEQRHDSQKIDGVVALDPVVLRNLLEATGPVDVSDSEILGIVSDTSLPTSLTEDNVIPTLLSDIYQEVEDPAVQDIYFAAVAGRVFTAFTEGQGNSAALIQALGKSVKDDRLYIWASREEEQKIIASTELAGGVTGPDSGGSTFGVYFNDGTGAKMDYHATRTVQLVQKCQHQGYANYTLRLTATNNAPADAASSLPPYVTGGGAFGIDPGHIRTNYVFYGPAQSFVETATVNGMVVPFGAGRHGKRPVGTVGLELSPGESVELDVVFSRVVQDSEPSIVVTPTLDSPSDVVLPSMTTSCD